MLNAPLVLERLIEIVEVDEIQRGTPIYLQGQPYLPTLYLILHGKVALTRNSRLVAHLGATEFFGEFPLLNLPATYSVSAVAADEGAFIASVPWDDVESVADSNAVVWKNLATELAMRLRRGSSEQPMAVAASSAAVKST